MLQVKKTPTDTVYLSSEPLCGIQKNYTRARVIMHMHSWNRVASVGNYWLNTICAIKSPLSLHSIVLKCEETHMRCINGRAAFVAVIVMCKHLITPERSSTHKTTQRGMRTDNWRKHLAYNLMAVLEWEIIELLQPQGTRVWVFVCERESMWNPEVEKLLFMWIIRLRASPEFEYSY